MQNKIRIDLKDLWRLKKYSYGLRGRPGNQYLARSCYKTGKKRGLALHREIVGARPGEKVDHADGNTFNNARWNLRVCTSLQNNYNARKRKDGQSKWKGVHPINNTTDKVWCAKIRANKKPYYLGCFEDEACAATAYNFAAAELHGEFAVFNTVAQPWLEAK